MVRAFEAKCDCCRGWFHWEQLGRVRIPKEVSVVADRDEWYTVDTECYVALLGAMTELGANVGFELHGF